MVILLSTSYFFIIYNMKYIADLHIHSPFSRATSSASNLAGLFAWAQVKGIHVIGTGDFTHPGWFFQLKEALVPAEPGFFRLKDADVPQAIEDVTPETIQVRFVLTAEISNIYKRKEKVRKVHNILLVPDFESAERINTRLASIGNIESDGRPILGLDSHDLLEIVMEESPEGFLVPAHIWTPWFSLFGSKSGFDAIEDCFGDLTGHIFALETGLSSDPDMNRMVSSLDRFTLISNSDCHSPSRLGREANMFDTGFDFFSIKDALKNPGNMEFLGTVEFFPEEGKYHLDGHRKCKICLDPEETRKLNGLCPVCNRPITIGVMHRVMELADRKRPYYPEGAPRFKNLIPIPEIMGEIMNLGPESKAVITQYARLIRLFGSEYNLFFSTPIEDIERLYSPLMAEAIKRIRTSKVIRDPGYDGEYGVIKVFEERELDLISGQLDLFSVKKQGDVRPDTTCKRFEQFIKQDKADISVNSQKNCLNPEQEEAVKTEENRILILAGPGTGKTFTLVSRMAQLLPANHDIGHYFTAITFTNRAADEIRQRLLKEVGQPANDLFVGTFHSFCLRWLREIKQGLIVVGEEARYIILKNLYPELGRAELLSLCKEIGDYFHSLATEPDISHYEAPSTILRYLEELERQDGIDLDAVIPFFVKELKTDHGFKKMVTDEVSYLFIDEFQDLNQSQYDLVKILAEKSVVFAIGDPNQAIYGFRGSKPDFFYRFADECNAKILTLTRNYRSSPAIINASIAVICNNPLKDPVTIYPQRYHQTMIEHYIAHTPKAEAEFVSRTIEGLIGGISHLSIYSGRGSDSMTQSHVERGFGDIAVFYRLSQQADILCKALEARGIPFQIVGSEPFFMKSGLRPVYYWIRLGVGHGEVEYISLLREIKAIGGAALRRLEMEIPISCNDFLSAARNIHIPVKAHEKLEEVCSAVRHFQEKVKAHGLAKALKDVMVYLGIDVEQPDPKRFIELANVFGKDLHAFSHHLNQNSTGTVYDERVETVSLMTLHASKGLEFPCVFITGFEEGIIPCRLQGLASNLEEERRLFYVGITRARDNLFLTSSTTRTLFGKTYNQTISGFADEIPPHLLKRTEELKSLKKGRTVKQLTFFE